MKRRPAGAADSSKDVRASGLVVAAYGRRGRLALPDGTRFPCVVRGRHLRIVCGDRVRYSPGGPGEPALVDSVLPRGNELQRLAARGSPETIAANVTHLVVVLAARPDPDPYLTDRYLCAARLMGATAAIAWNKADLSAPPPDVAAYARLECPVFPVSARAGTGLEALRAFIGVGTAALVGQSGVGKSSLLNALVPGTDAGTGALSTATDEGRHTTTASQLLGLPGGGALVDTPGVRDFVPAMPDQRAIAAGFVEIAEHGRGCRFADCSHLREEDCAVKAAVAAGRIDGRRYESYRRLMNLARQAAARDY